MGYGEVDVGGRNRCLMNFMYKSAFLSGANLNKTHPNSQESRGETGYIKAEKNLCCKTSG